MSQLAIKSNAVMLKQRKFLSWDLWEPIVKLMVLVLGLSVIIFALERGILFNWDVNRMLKLKSPFFKYLFISNSIVFVCALIFRTVLWFKYRPYDSTKVESWPEVTVLLPAYNEGKTVYTTICSIADSDYPEDKIRVIAVDDGSTDDTFDHMCRARDRFPDMVELIRFDKNKGKRQGLYQGFAKARTPFIITVDSDTLLEPNALRELIAPLLLDPKIGAVTGKIKIWNGDVNIYTKMLKANFAMAFDFTRAIQSTFNSVFCTSGAFSAYRASILHRVKEAWLGQTFLKQKCTYGEDRSLANHILRTGAGTVFQRTAVAFTEVPEKFPKMLKMLTRWARSNIRESIIFSKIMFSPNRKGNFLLPFIEFVTTIALVFLHIAMFYYFLLAGFVDGNFILRTFAYTMLFGFFYMLYYIRIEGTKDFPYIIVFSMFSSLFMVWIFTFAGLTLTKKSWSTR